MHWRMPVAACLDASSTSSVVATETVSGCHQISPGLGLGGATPGWEPSPPDALGILPPWDWLLPTSKLALPHVHALPAFHEGSPCGCPNQTSSKYMWAGAAAQVPLLCMSGGGAVCKGCPGFTIRQHWDFCSLNFGFDWRLDQSRNKLCVLGQVSYGTSAFS